MALKTFNLNEEVYKEFSKHCKEQGISMSKKVENFIKEEIARLRIKNDVLEMKERKEGKNDSHPMGKYC
ncbi:hypothetical protein COU62_02890 [Candidatus Pacearchaeota archaeon CG10_big_fil_rev_8_21_14_0_10_35_219]|nr:MAG: hypothetical protein AUJ63_00165 [Candidatus Pacearchaeota archaeon CG1_02_35_32]PIO07642.1 MAG: hypothetical protein COU62_02890 [Candidatus Pacearchaeota archaeon CG10_big_fil_rev_8_21_14_0_10_35_219]PIY81932.1 MAG: hypothetical protein COY79_00005 [Candidatus Pacearchaeota archaeon CG_4_10_14_0_8_um_filter_35_169]PIZ80873.1 MAG: hypothetical protein COY00_00295 [Candidatus Pacearchaeota archaeon CG_4_10_14_0_2_um_filter_35_33]PJA70006.1 MAG: hypothetical protein CO155_02275 [Candidat